MSGEGGGDHESNNKNHNSKSGNAEPSSNDEEEVNVMSDDSGAEGGSSGEDKSVVRPSAAASGGRTKTGTPKQQKSKREQQLLIRKKRRNVLAKLKAKLNAFRGAVYETGNGCLVFRRCLLFVSVFVFSVLPAPSLVAPLSVERFAPRTHMCNLSGCYAESGTVARGYFNYQPPYAHWGGKRKAEGDCGEKEMSRACPTRNAYNYYQTHCMQ